MLFEFLPRLRPPLLEGRPDSQPVQLGAPGTGAKQEGRRELRLHTQICTLGTYVWRVSERERVTHMSVYSFLFFSMELV